MASFEPRGSGVRVTVSLPGRKRLRQTFDTRVEAEAWAARAERAKALHELPAAAVQGVTVAELFEAYLDAHAAHTDTGRWNRLRILNWLTDPIASRPLAAIVTHDINEWIRRRLSAPSARTGDPVSAATVNRELNLMGAAFAYAQRDRGWITVNPCHGARRPERGRPRRRALLTARELGAIAQATGYRRDQPPLTATARVGACFLLALETGMRSGEILRLRPCDYWRERRTAHVAAIERGGRKAAKSGRASVDPSRNVPLTARAIELLDQLLASMPAEQVAQPDIGMSRPPYIVGLTDTQRDALWRKAARQAAVDDLHFHDAKHEAATRLARFLDVLELSHALGTKDIRLLRDTYYINDASRSAAKLPDSLA